MGDVGGGEVKIHISRRDSMYPRDTALCGAHLPQISLGRDVIRGRVVDARIWYRIPRMAQCQSCASLHGVHTSASDEHAVAVEVALHLIAKVWA